MVRENPERRPPPQFKKIRCKCGMAINLLSTSNQFDSNHFKTETLDGTRDEGATHVGQINSPKISAWQKAVTVVVTVPHYWEQWSV